MTNRVAGSLLCALAGVLLLVGGLLVPAHLCAVNVGVLREAGRHTPSLVQQGLMRVRDNNPGAARLLLQAAQQQDVPQWRELGQAITNSASQHPGWVVWGGGDTGLERLFASDVSLPKASSEPFTDFAVREENRTVILELLAASSQPAVQELIRCRALTNTVLFAPSHSAAGQAFDTALGICGLLLDRGHLSPAMNQTLLRLASESNRGDDSGDLEQVLMDFMSLGQRLNWGQLIDFVGDIQNPETLRQLANLVRNHEEQMPVLFAAVRLSGEPARVATYAMNFSQTGLADLGASLRFGIGRREGALAAQPAPAPLRPRRHPLGACPVRCGIRRRGLPVLADAEARVGGEVAAVLAGGLFAGCGAAFCAPGAPDPVERPLQVRGVHVARETLFALGFLLVVLLLSEPFLAQESQRVEFPLRLHLPTVGSVVPAGTSRIHGSIMNQLSLLTLLLFFVLQALLYTACLFKLAEIRRQNLGPRIKLKLLENEDHLFDAGPLPGLRRHHHLPDPGLAGGHPAQPHGCLLLHVLRHRLRLDL